MKRNAKIGMELDPVEEFDRAIDYMVQVQFGHGGSADEALRLAERRLRMNGEASYLAA